MAEWAPDTVRRGLVAGAAVGGVGLLVAGCAGPGGAASAPSPTGGSAGTVLGPLADVPVGGGTVYPTYEVVVTRPTDGDVRGFSAACTHTGCIVDRVADGTIDCPCHGSRYHLDGTVRTGPAPRALSGRPVSVVDGRVVLG